MPAVITTAPAARYTFTVTVPENTPDYTVVHIEFPNSWPHKAMEKVGEHTWQLGLNTLPSTQYRYNRDSLGFTSGEEFTPDSQDAWRTFPAGAREAVDVVGKWRWFPADGESLPDVQVATLAGSMEFLPRIEGTEFQGGMCFQDFWWDCFDELIEPSNRALEDLGVDWVEIYPPWAYTRTQPTVQLGEVGYSYGEAQLRNHLQQLQDDGFNIVLEPQLFGDVPEPGEYSDAWWDAWFAEFERYSIHYAQMAEEYGVEYLTISGDWIAYMHTDYPAPDADARFTAILDKVREHYSGKLGKSVFVGGGTPGDYYEVFPPLELTPALDEYDFFSVALWSGLTVANDASQEELAGNAEMLFETRIDQLYDVYGKPVILGQIAYPSHDGGATGVELPEDTTAEWEAYQGIPLDLGEQAMAYEAIMRAVAQRPYIIGTYPFVWFMEEFPLSVAYSVRGKPAEDIIIGWYEQAPD